MILIFETKEGFRNSNVSIPSFYFFISLQDRKAMVINMLVDNVFVSQAHLKIILNQYMKFQSKRRVCCITDIALALKISKPSVNRAVNTLKKQRSCFSRALRRYNSYRKNGLSSVRQYITVIR